MKRSATVSKGLYRLLKKTANHKRDRPSMTGGRFSRHCGPAGRTIRLNHPVEYCVRWSWR